MERVYDAAWRVGCILVALILLNVAGRLVAIVTETFFPGVIANLDFLYELLRVVVQVLGFVLAFFLGTAFAERQFPRRGWGSAAFLAFSVPPAAWSIYVFRTQWLGVWTEVVINPLSTIQVLGPPLLVVALWVCAAVLFVMEKRQTQREVANVG